MLSTMCGHGMVSPFPGEEDDRLGEGRPPHAGAGGDLYDALLFLRRFQSGACQTDSRRRPRQLQVKELS